MGACVIIVYHGATGTPVPYLAIDNSRTDTSTCPYSIEDGATNAWRELGNMSLENAVQISLSIGLVWAIAWGIKQIARALNSDEKESV